MGKRLEPIKMRRRSGKIVARERREKRERGVKRRKRRSSRKAMSKGIMNSKEESVLRQRAGRTDSGSRRRVKRSLSSIKGKRKGRKCASPRLPVKLREREVTNRERDVETGRVERGRVRARRGREFQRGGDKKRRARRGVTLQML